MSAEDGTRPTSGMNHDGKAVHRLRKAVADELRRYGNSLNSKTAFLCVLCVSAVNKHVFRLCFSWRASW